MFISSRFMFSFGGFVQLFRSLFCWHGVDQPFRFFLIILFSFILFSFTNITAQSNATFSIVILAISVITCLFSSRRRVANTNTALITIYLCNLLFFILGLLTIIMPTIFPLSVLFIPFLLLISLLRFPVLNQHSYTFGYAGDIDLSQYKKNHSTIQQKNKRIEPVLYGEKNVELGKQNTNDQYLNDQRAPSNSVEVNSFNHKITPYLCQLGQLVHRLIFTKNTSISIRAGFGFIVFILCFLPLLFQSSNSDENTIKDSQHEPIVTEKESELTEYVNKVTLPDDFSVMTTNSDGIVLQWDGDETANGYYWQLLNANGDKTCKEITFNSGAPIRAVDVKVINSNVYQARFSPLDTATLISHIALKGSFTLCGYSFSLKGSQKALGKIPYYANIIEY